MDNGTDGVRAAVHPVDHFALNVPSVPDAQHFFSAFGLEVSEVASSSGTEPGLTALDGHRWGRILHVNGIDDVGEGSAQMAAAGYRLGWGTGHHVPGSNYFHYVRDPWGSFCEYSADIDYITAGVTWPTGDHLPEDSLYLWGPDVPDYFIKNTET
jgi:catechol 2,3-dioxygenase-like lactoylglutathione lyase family enzyme